VGFNPLTRFAGAPPEASTWRGWSSPSAERAIEGEVARRDSDETEGVAVPYFSGLTRAW
jgi:hypothetical protein